MPETLKECGLVLSLVAFTATRPLPFSYPVMGLLLTPVVA